MALQTNTTPPRSRTSSRSSRTNLSLDLSDLPPLVQPSPPSNTLLVTNLNDPTIFAPTALVHFRTIIDNALTAVQQASTPEDPTLDPSDTLHAFSPLPSMRRIVLTFTTISAATHVRTVLDGTATASGDRVRVYFGADTPVHTLSDKERLLQAPKASKQFFISPPPSPPAGWTSKEEDPPNTDVIASDLAEALGRLGSKTDQVPDRPASADLSPNSPASRQTRARSNTGTIVYDPEDHGHSPDLPAIAVEDTTESPGDLTPVEGSTIMAHTARPPVELMSE